MRQRGADEVDGALSVHMATVRAGGADSRSVFGAADKPEGMRRSADDGSVFAAVGKPDGVLTSAEDGRAERVAMPAPAR